MGTRGTVVGTAALHDNLAQFGHRVALQTTSDESVNFLGVPHAAKLGSEGAYYRNEQWPADVLDKFKPYVLPSLPKVSSLVATVKTRWSKP